MIIKRLGIGALIVSALALLLVPSVAHANCTNAYTVQSGDWLSRIAPSDWQRIASDNGISNPNLIYVGQHLCLSGPSLPVTVSYQQPQQAQPRLPYRANIGYPGSCVWYVFNQRPDLVIPPTPYAKDFAWLAAQQGYATGNVPRIGAVVVFQPSAQGANPVAGHVAIVTAIYGNGSFMISEMAGTAGMWNVDNRMVSTGWGVSFIY